MLDMFIVAESNKESGTVLAGDLHTPYLEIKYSGFFAFSPDDSVVAVIGTDFVPQIKSTKRERIYELANEFQRKHPFVRFISDEDDNMKIETFSFFKNNFNSEIVFKLITYLSIVIEEIYPIIVRELV